MTLQLLTPIYPPEIKPVRDGWYLTRHPQSLYLEPHAIRWWTGGKWHSVSGDLFPFQDVWWRGLAFCPYTAIATTHTDVSIASQRVFEIDGVFLPGATCT